MRDTSCASLGYPSMAAPWRAAAGSQDDDEASTLLTLGPRPPEEGAPTRTTRQGLEAARRLRPGPVLCGSMSSLPRPLLSNILERVSRRTGRMLPALVCRSWYEVFLACRLCVTLHRWARIPDAVLIHELAPLTRVTSLRLPRGSLLQGLTEEVFLLNSNNPRWPRLQALALEEVPVEFPEAGGPDPPPGLAPTRFFASLRSLVWRYKGMFLPEAWVLGLPGLTRLRLGLSTAPVISAEIGTSLSSLRALHFERLPNVRELPASLGQLRQLRVLKVKDLPLLEALPPSLGEAANLRALHLARCASLRSLPQELTQLRCLKDLLVECCCCLPALPEPLGRNLSRSLHRVRLLHLGLRTLPQDLGECCSLKELRVHVTPTPLGQMQELPFDLLHLTKLEVLSMDIPSLAKFPPGSENLSRLKLMELSSLELQVLPEEVLSSSSSSLRALRLWCPALQSLPEGLEQMKQLEELCLGTWRSGCDSLARVPGALTRFSALKSLSIRSMAVRTLPGNAGSAMPSLTDLRLEDWCGSAETLEEFLGGLPGLQVLFLKCHHSAPFPRMLWWLRQLRVLQIDTSVPWAELGPEETARVFAEQQRKLPWGGKYTHQDPPPEELPGPVLSGLTSLESLLVWGGRLCALPETISSLRRLSCIRLVNCYNLETVGAVLCGPTALKELHLQHLPRLHSLQSLSTHLGSLERLTILSCPELRDLGSPDAWRLRRLCVGRCNDSMTRSLVQALAHLSTLEELEVDCAALRYGCGTHGLPASPSLQVLRVTACSGACGGLLPHPDHFSCLPETLDRLARLEVLDIQAWCVRELPESLARMTSLQEIRVADHRQLLHVPWPLEDLGRLRREDRDMLEEASRSLGRVERLEVNGLPRCFCSMPFLTDLTLSDDAQTASLADLGKLKVLCFLSLRACHVLTEIDSSLGALRSLEKLHISFCPLLVRLPKEMGKLPHLQDLAIEACPEVEEIPSLSQALSLRRCRLAGLLRLLRLPELPLSALMNLVVEECSTRVPDTVPAREAVHSSS